MDQGFCWEPPGLIWEAPVSWEKGTPFVSLGGLTEVARLWLVPPFLFSGDTAYFPLPGRLEGATQGVWTVRPNPDFRTHAVLVLPEDQEDVRVLATPYDTLGLSLYFPWLLTPDFRQVGAGIVFSAPIDCTPIIRWWRVGFRLKEGAFSLSPDGRARELQVIWDVWDPRDPWTQFREKPQAAQRN